MPLDGFRNQCTLQKCRRRVYIWKNLCSFMYLFFVLFSFLYYEITLRKSVFTSKSCVVNTWSWQLALINFTYAFHMYSKVPAPQAEIDISISHPVIINKMFMSKREGCIVLSINVNSITFKIVTIKIILIIISDFFCQFMVT